MTRIPVNGPGWRESDGGRRFGNVAWSSYRDLQPEAITPTSSTDQIDENVIAILWPESDWLARVG